MDVYQLNKKWNLLLGFIFLLIIALEIGTQTLVSFFLSVPIGYATTALLCFVSMFKIKRSILIGICIFIFIDHVFGAIFLRFLSNDPEFHTASNFFSYWPNFLIGGLVFLVLIITVRSKKNKVGL